MSELTTTSLPLSNHIWLYIRANIFHYLKSSSNGLKNGKLLLISLSYHLLPLPTPSFETKRKTIKLKFIWLLSSSGGQRARLWVSPQQPNKCLEKAIVILQFHSDDCGAAGRELAMNC